MKKLMTLTIVAVALLSQAGCANGWSRWLCRGDDCGAYSTASGCADGMTSGSTLMSPSYGPTYGPSTYGPATNELPGPVTTIPQG